MYIKINIALHPTNKNCIEEHLLIHCSNLFHQSFLSKSICVLYWAPASPEGVMTDGIDLYMMVCVSLYDVPHDLY